MCDVFDEIGVGLSRHFAIYLNILYIDIIKRIRRKEKKERKTDKKKEKREKINYVYIVSFCQAFVNIKIKIFKKSSYFKIRKRYYVNFL